MRLGVERFRIGARIRRRHRRVGALAVAVDRRVVDRVAERLRVALEMAELPAGAAFAAETFIETQANALTPTAGTAGKAAARKNVAAKVAKTIAVLKRNAAKGKKA